MMKTAKLFWSGRSQAVRLPQVRIRRHGDQIILEPIAKDWAWLDALVGLVDEDFARAVNEQPDQQQRPELDELFP